MSAAMALISSRMGRSLSAIGALESRAPAGHIALMSKAFTKESDDTPDDDGPDDGPALPSGQPNYITPAGLKRLQDELQNLLRVERSEEHTSELQSH